MTTLMGEASINTINFKKFSCRVSSDFVTEIKSHLATSGIVCIQNINLNETEFLELSQNLGSVLNIPSFLAPSKCVNHTEIARVSNFREDGCDEKFDPNYSFGAYWHHDGDFWENNRIFNLLYSRVVAKDGGKTGIIDTIKAYESLSEAMKSRLSNAVVTVDPRNIEDFRNLNVAMAGFTAVEHRLVQIDTITGIKSLYLPYFEGSILCGDRYYTHEELMRHVDKEEFRYIHTWQENEMLIWDNTQCMHRSMGGIVGKRLLWRTQARLQSDVIPTDTTE